MNKTSFTTGSRGLAPILMRNSSSLLSMMSAMFVSLLLFISACSAQKNTMQTENGTLWSKRIADSFLERHPGAVTYDSGSPNQRWNYEQGLMLVALLETWRHTGDRKYFEFVRANLDLYVEESGSIKTYSMKEYNKDHIGPGRALLGVYLETKNPKYRFAADSLRQQLREQPRTKEGGYWHKKIYPYQMWLDGVFMAEPFHAWYEKLFNAPGEYDDIVNQFLWLEAHTRDPKTGLFYHAWDESKQQQWANPETGCSPHFWGRAIGWYAMGIVDVLDYLPAEHPKREKLIAIVKDLSASLLNYRDKASHRWYQIIDQGNREGNYLETSSSAMFAYVFAKGANKGYLGGEYITAAKETFQGIIEGAVTLDSTGNVNLHDVCAATGLGGTPYRDGSYQYYISVPKVTNDKRGIGPFLLAAIEIEKAEKNIKEDSK